jgi:hypothetical protein
MHAITHALPYEVRHSHSSARMKSPWIFASAASSTHTPSSWLVANSLNPSTTAKTEKIHSIHAMVNDATVNENEVYHHPAVYGGLSMFEVKGIFDMYPPLLGGVVIDFSNVRRASASIMSLRTAKRSFNYACITPLLRFLVFVRRSSQNAECSKVKSAPVFLCRSRRKSYLR